MEKTITVIGCGYVGVTTAAVLANCGFTVYAIEINPKRLNILKQGRSFFYEAGINPLIAKGTETGTLIFTDSYDKAIPESSVVFSCVGTPDNPDGSSNLNYVYDSAEQTARHVTPGSIFVQKSTVPVGTGLRVEKIFTDMQKEVRYVSNPEFLSESTAVIDTLWFDRIVTGSDDSAAADAVLDIYRIIEERRDTVAQLAGLERSKAIPESRYIRTGRNSAELIKVSANAFLALKISFANSIAKLADKAAADVTEVMTAVGADNRIGGAFLNAGRGYGGGCFPKDVIGLIRSAGEFGVDMEIMDAAVGVNDSMPHYIIGKATAALSGSIEGKRCTVLGLAFKSGTSDARHSPPVVMANTLVNGGADVRVYDPQAMDEVKSQLDKKITTCATIDEAIAGSDCVFIATDWPEFVNMTDEQFSGMKIVVDCMNCIDTSKLPNHLTYMGVGK